MKVTYKLIKGDISDDDKNHPSYGIAMFLHDAEGKRMIGSVCNITFDKARLAKLIKKCNRLALSPIHLNDVIEDFLVE